jgi:hypothetical protein
MWVIGEVTLMERRDERHIKKPRVPFAQVHMETGKRKWKKSTHSDQGTPHKCHQRRAGTLLSPIKEAQNSWAFADKNDDR